MEEQALQLNPELAKRCLQSAHLFMEKKRYLEALKLFDEVIAKHQPQNVEAYLESAKIYDHYKKPQSIMKVINLLHGFSPKTPESLVLLARAQFLSEELFGLPGNAEGNFHQEKGFLGSGGPGSRSVPLYRQI